MADQDVHSPEVRLIAAAGGGDRDAQRELFERYRRVAFEVAVRITRRRDDALDVVQDSFIKVFAKLDTFEGGAGFKTWFLRIVTNTSLDFLRRRKVRAAVSLEGDDDVGPADFVEQQSVEGPGERMERRELGERLREAIDLLPPDHRAVFSLYASGEVTYAEIAEVVGIPMGTVMSRIYHARRKLHATLRDLMPATAKRSGD